MRIRNQGADDECDTIMRIIRIHAIVERTVWIANYRTA